MPYKTILVHVDDAVRAAPRTRLAAALAERFGAHLIGAALTGISRYLYQVDPSAEQDPHLLLHLTFLRERAQAAVQAFHAMVGERCSVEAAIVEDEAAGGISLLARSADLAIVGQAAPGENALDTELPGYVVTNAGCPVLLVPHGCEMLDTGRRILVAWNGSKEAARAVTGALPFVMGAERVQVASFEKGREPAPDLLPFLARHGVNAIHSHHTPTPHNVGAALLALAADTQADLLVMGAYGHSRLRETILGGATRTVLETATLPVLMTH